MRDTPSCLPASASQRPAQPRWMQFLSLSYYPFHGFVYASEADKSQFGHAAQVQPQPQAPGQPQLQPQAQAPGTASVQPQPQQIQSTSGTDTSTNSGMIMTTIPLPSSATLFQHFVYACQPFWCHRHTHAVPGGMVYDIGDFRVRIGDVRQTQPVARVRGTVVEVEWRGPSLFDSLVLNHSVAETQGGDGEDDDSGIDVGLGSIEEEDVDAEFAATAGLIREFWGRLGVEGAREAILVPDVGKEVKERLRRLKAQLQEGKKEVGGRGDGEGNGQLLDEDPDPQAGVDIARQFMEIFRFSR